MSMFEFDQQFTMFDVTPVENLFIDEYMLAAPGDFVKVYLYALRQAYHPPLDMSYEKIARALCMEPDDVKNAFVYWERQGLLQRVSDNPPAFHIYNLKAALMSQRQQDDGLYRYRDFNNRVQSMFKSGRLLHESDTRYLYDWMEVYKLPESVVLILVEYLLNRRGPNVRFSSCDKIAREWAEKGIITEEAAREQLRTSTESYALTKKVLQALGIRTNPTQEQEHMYAAWTEMGFDNGAIMECCRQTAGAQRPSMSYLDSILRAMHERGLHTAREISEYNEDYRAGTARVRDVLKALGQPAPIGMQDLLATYRQWQEMGYSHESILLTARALRRMNSGTFDMLDRAMRRMKDENVVDEVAVARYYDEIFTYAEICDALLARLGLSRHSTAADREAVKRWSTQYSMSFEMMQLAADRARDASGSKLAYMDGILKNWRDKDLTTPDALAKDEAQHRARPSTRVAETGRPEGAAGYTQREYTKEDIAGFYTDIMKDEGDDS